MRRPLPLLALLLLGLLNGCGGEIETPGEALRIFGTALPPAYQGDRYSAPIHAVGGLRPYEFTLTDGSLPPGVELLNGSLEGVPSELGSYAFTVSVSDANLSKTFQEYTLVVTEVPPPSLTLNAPETEVRAAVTLRAEVRDARDLRALRTLVRWDPQRFELVADSVRSAGGPIALLSDATPGRLQVDLTALATGFNGERRLFTFDLRPLEPSPLELTVDSEFISRDERRDFSSDREGGVVPFAGELPFDASGGPLDNGSGGAPLDDGSGGAPVDDGSGGSAESGGGDTPLDSPPDSTPPAESDGTP